MIPFIDSFGRQHTYLRVSVTDACNMRCTYCDPFRTGRFTNDRLLSMEEILRLVRLFVTRHGITKLRMTGGEPMVRKDILSLFHGIAELKTLYPLSVGMTTNGTLLCDHLPFLRALGLDALNISIDSLDRDLFRSITGMDALPQVLETFRRAQELVFPSVKANVVIMRGVNDHEIPAFVRFAAEYSLTVRFIEYMPLAQNRWETGRFLDYRSMKRIAEEEGTLIPMAYQPHSVSKDYRIAGSSGMVSFISSVSEHFCGGCNRLRLTADGRLRTCLFALPEMETDLRALLRSDHGSNEAVADAVRKALRNKWEKHPDPEILAATQSNVMRAIGG
ncbi:MAG: GTP 3',8-cyclase MoaA [Bacteroidetes bacterium]|nr:MAG: GTP 3',8-cyclase MoaA [Bacteroidota bacterium]